MLAGGIAVTGNQVVQVAADSGIRLEVGHWVPERDSGYGWWGAVPAGGSSDDRINWSQSQDALLLPPGRYDVYWKQDIDHEPMMLAGGIAVTGNQVVQVAADSGIRLEVGHWVPERDSGYGWWGAVPAGGSSDDRINWSQSQDALLLPPGAL